VTNKTILLNALKRMLSSQFEEVFFHADIPTNAIAPGAQNTRALELIKTCEASSELAKLENAIQTVAPGVLKACRDEVAKSVSTPVTQVIPELTGDILVSDKPPKVFISYSHDSPEHRDFVLQLSDKLLEDGIDCTIDQHINGSPPEGWPLWMENQIKDSDFILIMCTPVYLQRFRRELANTGRGVAFEGLIITQTLYDHYYRNTKFLPIIPEHGNSDEDVPITLKSYTTYRIFSDYENHPITHNYPNPHKQPFRPQCLRRNA
jgi:hypothetical protein